MLASRVNFWEFFSSGGSADLTEEYDEKERKAEVLLYTTEIPAVGRTDKDDLKHWQLVFVFWDGNKPGSVRVVEAGNYNDTLTPYYTKESPREPGTEKKLGVIYVSPAQVREAAVRNKLNGKKYNFATMNCQEWIKEFVKVLGYQSLMENLDEKASTFREKGLIMAYLLASSKEVGRSFTSLFN